MRFLVDNALSRAIADGLRSAGHDAIHVCDRGLAAADDPVVFALAVRENRCLVSADTDFGTILAETAGSAPSVILFRGEGVHQPHSQLMLLLTNLTVIEAAVEDGSIVVIERTRIRVRRLPLGTD